MLLESGTGLLLHDIKQYNKEVFQRLATNKNAVTVHIKHN